MKALQTAVAIALLMPALAMAQKVSFDFDKTEDFSRIKSYTLKDGTKVNDPLVHNRIIAAMESELAAKGLSKNDATPDAVVVYHIAFDKKQDITTFSSGGGYGPYGYGWGGGWGTTDVRVNEILVGTLVIDVADATKKSIVWRGMGVKEVDVQAKAEKRDKNIAAAVKKILKDFPPPTKK